MCKRFEDGLNEDIRLIVGILELREFMVLLERACKAEGLAKKNKKADIESKNSRKRQMAKSQQILSKRSREFPTRSNTPECSQCSRRHFSECRGNERGCFKCGSLDHFIRNCPKLDDKEKKQDMRVNSAPSRGKPQKNPGSGASSRGAPRDSTMRSEGRAPTRTYAIRARKEVYSLDVITGSTRSYVFMKLVPSMNMPIESIEFVVKVSNPLGKHVLVDKIYRNCHLMVRGYCFLAKLMLLPFDEIDLILGMDWLTSHGVIVDCERKAIELKCEDGNVLRVEPDESDNSFVVISSMTAERYLRKGMAPAELKELKVQLKELTDKEFARPSFPP
ncbi:uncharacterized protein [Gossypium hirsutum]|uniref:CCHC-type domain-containing protein n=1 Tax=Gossypium hirsutum TaxID=3635 RepID=A0ABM2ZA30_GOSHI|nr:uncharacterized protein LOC121211172 [Gossypium hirsutum]